MFACEGKLARILVASIVSPGQTELLADKPCEPTVDGAGPKIELESRCTRRHRTSRLVAWRSVGIRGARRPPNRARGRASVTYMRRSNGRNAMYSRFTSIQQAPWNAHGTHRVHFQPSTESERHLTLRQRVLTQMLGPGVRDRISSNARGWRKKIGSEARRSRGRHRDRGRPRTARAPHATTTGAPLPPRRPSCDWAIASDVVMRPRARPLDGEWLGIAGEERLANDGIIDQIKHVGRVEPQLC